MSDSRATPKSRTVTFLQPGSGTWPNGGARVVYEYANGLAQRGWQVRVVHPYLLSSEQIDQAGASFIHRGRRWLGYQRRRTNYRPDRWFDVDPKVQLLWTKTPYACLLPASDIWVATYWYTAKWVASYSGRRVYLIQHLETWAGPEADVLATWKLPLRKIVISRWLEDVAHNLGESADYIPNGLNFQVFGLDIPPEDRDPHTVAMMYHASDWKGSADGLVALRKAKVRVPMLKAHIFGVSSPPPDFPSWAEYHRNPPQRKLREIYNRAAIFLSPSWTEGWPLPPAEAQQCGAALVATDIGGHREYARHEENALLSQPKDADALAANAVRLLGDQELRLRLALQGHDNIQQFTWNRAVTRFASVLENELSHHTSAAD
jgi:glycosyltransferase involved in cell wall biosynthesis